MKGTIRLLSTGPIQVEGLRLKVGEPLEVMPVSEHEAALAAARQVDEAAKRRAIDGMLAKSDDATPSMKVVARAMWSEAIDTYDRERAAALLAALTVPEPEETP